MLKNSVSISIACMLLLSNTQASRLRAKGFFDEDPFAMADPFGGSSSFGQRRDPFFDDGFGAGSFGDFPHAFAGIDKQMARMQDSFDHPLPAMAGGEGHSQSFSSSSSSSSGADGKVHKKQSKTGSETKCHNGVCKTISCAGGKCKESSQKADVLAKQAKEEEATAAQHHKAHRPRRSPFAAMEGMFGGMPDPAESFRKEMKGMDGMMKRMSSPEAFKKMAGPGAKIHQEMSKMGSSMKCANGKCEKTVCQNGKCKTQVMGQPGAAGGAEEMHKMPMKIILGGPSRPSPEEAALAKKQVEAAVDAKQKSYEKTNAPPAFAPKHTSKPSKSDAPANSQKLQLAPEAVTYYVVDQPEF